MRFHIGATFAEGGGDDCWWRDCDYGRYSLGVSNWWNVVLCTQKTAETGSIG